VLIQRRAEELYSARNTRVLVAAGAREVGQDFYPLVVTTHLAWEVLTHKIRLEDAVLDGRREAQRSTARK
jgi:isoprenylcysteine carboxyl methyltransferase (ICMT) family protein YpbQ